MSCNIKDRYCKVEIKLFSIWSESFSSFLIQFPMGPGSDGPMGGLGGMESHHMNGSLGKDFICIE